MIHYLDTSALAKRYVHEPGSDSVRAVCRRGRIVVARITFAELLAAIARACRDGVITEPQRGTLFARIDEDFADFTIIEIRPALLREVPGLVVRHPLRGYDAVQLAAALAVRAQGGSTQFWSADAQLANAARAEGLRTKIPG